MGIISNRINPSISNQKQSQLKMNTHIQVSRRNFRFISKISTTGSNQQSVIWLAENWNDPTQKFFVKATSKLACFRHSRVQSLMTQLSILCKQSGNKLMVQPLFAFQDYSYLYLVHSFRQYFTLEQVLQHHIFSQQQAKYVIIGLINIIQRLHQRKYALCQLHPRNIVVDRNGQMKIFQLVNPLPIDSYYPSSMISPLNCYSAPQILLMDRVLAQSDYFSLGLIMYYIMKNKPAIVLQSKQDVRMKIVNATIEVDKCDLPEGWRPEAADFLVKLLIKNPELRLGRYGSFQVKSHRWLQNDVLPQICMSTNLDLRQDYFKQIKYPKLQKIQKDKNLQKQRELLNQDYEFQIQFQNYQYRQNQDQIEQDIIRQQYQ